MKIDDIRNLFINRKIELDIISREYYVLGQLIKVLEEADKNYKRLLWEISTKEQLIISSPDSLSKSTQKDLDNLIKREKSGLIEIVIKNVIIIDECCIELSILKDRFKVLHELCKIIGIDSEMYEEKKCLPLCDSTVVFLSSTFQVPISMLESTRELDVETVKLSLKLLNICCLYD